MEEGRWQSVNGKDDHVSTTAILLLVVGVETALVMGFAVGLMVGGNLENDRLHLADVSRKLGFHEGKLAQHELTLARAQGRVEATEHLQRLTKTALTDVSRAGRRAAS